VEIKLTLALPRDQLSVPVVRRVLKQSMQVLGVSSECTGDIELALTEACTNVLDHATTENEYEVSAGIDGDVCVIEVVDRGAGFDSSGLGVADAADDAEEGRGIQLMRALVDKVTFTSRPTQGTVVHLEKALSWQDSSVIQQLTEDNPEPEHGPWSRADTLDDAPEPIG
jgi:serine/threonine-protein kinase RsbW